MAGELMTNLTGGLSGDLSPDEKAAKIRSQAESLLTSASLTQVQARMPECVDVVKALMAEIIPDQPMTIAQAGGWALENQAQAGMQLLDVLSRSGASQQALVAVDNFDAELRKRIKPLEERLAARRAKLDAKGSPLARLVSLPSTMKAAAENLLSSKDTRRARRSEQLQDTLGELSTDGKTLAGIVEQTYRDTVQLQRILAANKDVPGQVAKTVEHVIDTHTEAGERIYLTLVAVNEVHRDLTDKTLPALETVAESDTAMPEDLDRVKRHREALGLLEAKRTDLMGAFVGTYLQRGMAAEMANILAASAMEMARLETGAIPQMISMLGNVALQHKTGELVHAAKFGNNVLAEATTSTAKGFGLVLAETRAADEARIATADAIVAATSTTLRDLAKHREHQAKFIERQRAAQGRLAQAVGDLSLAASRLGSSSATVQRLPDDASTAATDRIAQMATGVSLPQLRAAATNPASSAIEPTRREIGGHSANAVDVSTPSAPPANRAAELFAARRRGRGNDPA